MAYKAAQPPEVALRVALNLACSCPSLVQLSFYVPSACQAPAATVTSQVQEAMLLPSPSFLPPPFSLLPQL